MEGIKIMENKNNIDWNVNLNYITKDDLKTIYGFIPDADQTTIDNTKTDFTIMAIAISSERINTITGNQIEVIGFKNLNETQQQLVKRATARMTIYYLTDGMAFIRSSVSISGNGLSSSISPPTEPDYVLMEVYNLLQQSNLHTPRKAINNPISCNTDNFNTPSIFDESDTRVITWDSGNKTFLQKIGIIEGTGIKIDDITDTIPKLKIHVDSNIDSLWEVDKDNPNFIKPKDDKGIDVNGRRIIDVGTPTFLSDATTKVYVDNLLDKKQDKLIAGENITIDKETNTISATGGSSESLWEVDPNSPNIIQPKEKRIITSNNTRIVDIGEPEQEKDATTKQYVDNLLDKKQDKEKWLIVATSVINGVNQTITYDCKENKRYRIWFNYGIRRQTLILSDIYIYEEFIYSKGSNTELTFDINHSQPYLICNRTNTPIFTWLAGNTRNGNLWKLEELEENNENIYKITSNTLNIISPNKINMNKPIKIISNNLETNEIEENCWDIELKNNPIPSIPKWKEVGTKININHIKYTFKSNTKYKIYYNFESQSSNKKFAFMCKEFLYGELNKEVQTLDWDKVNDRIIISLQMQNDTIAIVSDPTRFGQLLKLEELQE
ncbi:hypothetical protein [Spiroplasma endosymbiont of Danaus chrysippus]|uniref:hypothetical protein n=1 Tax=Spiroplasma endosymbiont of Danaus chrysippus TaxID=2691041 RepID=UPI0013CADAF0|nr:hypothetical protein [Spiroplasma endosymbiont of Danaus chrysippus]CAB1053572.1 hypothetical protein [Spiroplasma endosymbiont of Danaus chrysippus]